MLEGFADSYRRFGLRVTGVEADRDDDDPFPYLMIYVEDERVEGERVARYSLEHNGRLLNPPDAAESVAMWVLESAPADIRRLPLSGRARGGSDDG